MAATRDAHYMRLALELARRAEGWTSPNPLVGAVVVRGGRVAGRGYHRRAGGPHAEVVALRQAGARARGATLYATLEPCDHVGRTPPCTEAVLASGVRRVVIGARDPNPITNGRGVRRLRRAGLAVTTGVLVRDARTLNAPFEKAMRHRLPWVVAKVAQSLDGKIATTTGASRWISSPASRADGHALRSRVDAILVGRRTVERDDPRLTVRGRARRLGRPVRVIVDSRLRLPLSVRCLSDASSAPTIVATVSPPVPKRRRLARRGIEVWQFPSRRGRVPLRRLCRALVDRGIHSVLIEGGGELLASALEERLVDRLVIYAAPRLIGGRTAPGAVAGDGIARLAQAIRLTDARIRRIGSDLRIEAAVTYPSR